MVCGNCGAILDATDPDFRLIARYEARKVSPLIPLGTRGHFGAETYEAIGYLVRRTVGDEGFTWFEYLLYNPTLGLRWLVEYHGHWVMSRAAAGVPDVTGRGARYQGVDYRLFQTSRAKVIAVVGEFPWTPRVDDAALIADYVAPPRILSSERTDEETTWSTGEYVDGHAVWKAFGLKDDPPPRIGVGAAQPSPYTSGRTMFLLTCTFLAAVILVHLLFSIVAQQHLVADVTGEYRPNTPDAALVVSEPFSLSGRASNVMVEISTNLANRWSYFTLTLVNEDTGIAKTFGREVSYYYGRDSDGSWTEGSNWDRTYLPSVVSGSYVLLVEPEGPSPVAWRVRLTRDVPRPLWMWLALGAMLLPPIFFVWRRSAFEARRWSESDTSVPAEDNEEDEHKH